MLSLVFVPVAAQRRLFFLFSIIGTGTLIWTCSNLHVCAVFFDITKAFDSVPHKPLLLTLSSNNFPPHLISLLRSYLCNCTRQVMFSLCQISCSIRGSSRINTRPSSFIHYVDGLSSLPISQSASLTLYIDDIFLSQPLVSPFCMFSVQSKLYKSHLLLVVLSLSFC